jgi:hypothetical protein
MQTTDEIRPIRQTDGKYDGDGSLEGKGLLFEFRGERYLWTFFDLGISLFIDGGSYPRKRLTYGEDTPMLLWYEQARPGAFVEGRWDRGVERLTRPATPDESDLCAIAKAGGLDVLAMHEADRAWLDSDRAFREEAAMERAVEDGQIPGASAAD